MHTCHDTASQCLPHLLRILENIWLQKTLFCVHKARHRFETHLMCVIFSEQITQPPPTVPQEKGHFRQILSNSNFNCFNFCDHVLYVRVDDDVSTAV